jgi:hypothetical protein
MALHGLGTDEGQKPGQLDTLDSFHRSTVSENQVNPSDLWPYPSRLAVQFVVTDCRERPDGSTKMDYVVRHPYTPEMRAKKVHYDKRRHFYPQHETSQILDACVAGIPGVNGPVTYGVMRLHIPSPASRRRIFPWLVRAMGLDDRPASGVIDRETGIRYRIIKASFIGDGDLLLVPMSSGITSVRQLGLSASSDPKAAKRERRLKAHHDLMLEFTVTAQEPTADGILYTFHHDRLNRDFTVLDFDMTSLSTDEDNNEFAFVDGTNVTNLFSRLFGREYDHIAITGAVPNVGVNKGLGDANPLVKHDVVLYGTKKELVLEGSTAYLGVLSFVRGHRAFMDSQTLINQGFYEEHLAPAEARHWMTTVFQTLASENQAGVLDLFSVLANLDTAPMVLDAESEAEVTSEGEESRWAVEEAMRNGIGHQYMPVLWRRLFKLMFERPIDPASGRIPMFRDGLMKRLYIKPNLLAFTETGRPSKALDELSNPAFLAATFPEAIRTGLPVVCCPELPTGLLWMVRNPNTHCAEAALVFNVHYKPLMKYRGRGLLFLSFDAVKLLPRLNGADLDDNVLATTNPEYIAKWRSLQYPVVDKIQTTERPATSAVDNADVESENPIGLREEMWCWTEPGMGLGQYMNLILLDNLLSGEHKVAALEYLREQQQTNGTRKAIWFLEQRGEFLLRREASYADRVIDWLQMRKGNKAFVEGLMTHALSILEYTDPYGVVQPIPCFPMIYDLAGRSRVPYARKVARDYIVVETRACQAINRLVARRNRFLELARQIEWMLAQPIPETVRSLFEADQAVRDTANTLRRAWRDAWHKLHAEYPDGLPDDAYDQVVNGKKISRGLTDREPGFNQTYYTVDGNSRAEADRLPVAVEMYRQIYRKRRNVEVNEDGTTSTYRDGLPDSVLRDYLTALEQAGLTGLVAFVRLDSRAKLRLKTPVAVRIVNGRINTWVIQQDNGLKLGVIPEGTKVPDGAYAMSPQGVVVVKQSDESLHSTFKVDQLAKRAAGAVDEVGADVEDDDDGYAF